MYLELLDLDKINAPRRQASEADGGDGGESHHFNPTILRESDIRGIVGKTLFAEDALALGRAFGTIVRACGGSRVCVGYDGRLSSPDLEAALVEGLAQTGITVHRIGRGPTPMLYFSIHELDTHGGIMVTGSHNPTDYNGFKMMFGQASFFGRDIKQLGERATSGAVASGDGGMRPEPQSHASGGRRGELASPWRFLSVRWHAPIRSWGPASSACWWEPQRRPRSRWASGYRSRAEKDRVARKRSSSATWRAVRSSGRRGGVRWADGQMGGWAGGQGNQLSDTV